jgi:hypothetical protein
MANDDKKMTRPFLAGFGEQGFFGLTSAAALSSGESLLDIYNIAHFWCVVKKNEEPHSLVPIPFLLSSLISVNC